MTCACRTIACSRHKSASRSSEISWPSPKARCALRTSLVKSVKRTGRRFSRRKLKSSAWKWPVEVAIGVAEHMLRRQWAMLTSVVGVPSLPQGGVAGRIDADLPPLDQDQLLASLLATSPAVRAAQAKVERAEATLRRAKREPVPRSEEHTSELQSLAYLVCRLLL